MQQLEKLFTKLEILNDKCVTLSEESELRCTIERLSQVSGSIQQNVRKGKRFYWFDNVTVSLLWTGTRSSRAHTHTHTHTWTMQQDAERMNALLCDASTANAMQRTSARRPLLAPSRSASSRPRSLPRRSRSEYVLGSTLPTRFRYKLTTTMMPTMPTMMMM